MTLIVASEEIRIPEERIPDVPPLSEHRVRGSLIRADNIARITDTCFA